jgi:hypothetical protein
MVTASTPPRIAAVVPQGGLSEQGEQACRKLKQLAPAEALGVVCWLVDEISSGAQSCMLCHMPRPSPGGGALRAAPPCSRALTTGASHLPCAVQGWRRGTWERRGPGCWNCQHSQAALPSGASTVAAAAAAADAARCCEQPAGCMGDPKLVITRTTMFHMLVMLACNTI